MNSRISRGNSSSFLCSFHPDDSLLLSNGVLWDYRHPRPIHKFERFSNYGVGKLIII